MDNVLVSLFCIGMILFITLTVAQTSLSAKDEVAMAWKQMEQTSSDRARTDISICSSDVFDAGAQGYFVIENTGQLSLEDYAQWDVICEWLESAASEHHVGWFDYTTSGTPSNGEWRIEGTYIDEACTTQEVFNDGVFDPGEYFRMHLKVASPIKTSAVHRLLVATDNGVVANLLFTRDL